MEQQEMDKRRQSQFHAYYAYTGSYERTMELDSVGIDRFFEAVGDMSFEAEVGFLPEDTYTFHRKKGVRSWLSVRAVPVSF